MSFSNQLWLPPYGSRHARATAAVTLICLALVPATASWASVEQPLADGAKKLALELQSQNISSLKLVVQEPIQLASSLPNTIREVIGRELEAAGMTLVRSSAERIVHVVAKLVDEPAQTPHIDVEFTLLNQSGQELLKLPVTCQITGTSNVGSALGLPVDASNKSSGQSRLIGPGHIKDVLPGTDEAGQKRPGPQSSIRDHVIRAHQDGMFGIEILVNGKSADASVDAAGYAEVNVRKGDAYEVRLVNDGNFDVLVALTLDGVDSGWFSPEGKVLWVVKQGSSSLIRGWLTARGGAKFEAADHDESVAASLGQIGDVGVIQASFFRAYAPGEPKDPSDKGQVGTKLGDPFEWDVRSVNLERGSKLRAIIPVRYGKQ